jgi:hypothetical protein
MSLTEHQQRFINLVQSKLSESENRWLDQKTTVLSDLTTIKKFPIFFSLAARFVSSDIPQWNVAELQQMENIYPGFGKATWTKQDLARVVLMIQLDTNHNKQILESFFESAEMLELVSFFKGLFLLENASEFTKSVEEGIRTNMVNVFDSFTAGNPYASTYLEEWAWNQLILKAFFMDRPLYTIHNLDQGKNENLANMLQDFVKERWAAGRTVSPEIWRMIEGNLRDDVKQLMLARSFEGTEKKAIEMVTNTSNESKTETFWDNIGKNKP